MWPNSKKQESIVETAKVIAKEIAPTSHHFDLNASFPTEHFDLMREKGYLKACIPENYGGMGHGITAMVLSQYEIGKACGSTAVSVGMHHQVVGTESETHQWPQKIRSKIFNDVVRTGAVTNNIASEPELGSPRGGGRPSTSLTKLNDTEWILNGRKTWSTLSPVLTYAMTLAAVEDGSGDVARIVVDMGSTGISIKETWNSMSMRATGSHDILFENVKISEKDFISRSNPQKPAPVSANGTAWFPMLLSGANLGIAHSARNYAIEFALKRKPTGATGTISDIPHIREQIARMESQLLRGRRNLLSCCEDWESYPNDRKELSPEVSMVKVQTIETAISITDLAMRIVGAVGLDKDKPLERYFRDVRSGISNPPIEARALQQLATHLLNKETQTQ